MPSTRDYNVGDRFAAVVQGASLSATPTEENSHYNQYGHTGVVWLDGYSDRGIWVVGSLPSAHDLVVLEVVGLENRDMGSSGWPARICRLVEDGEA